MFTGLVRELGRLIADPVPSGQGGVRLRLAHSPELGARLSIGASLAVSGVCLTVIAQEPGACEVELSPETLARTHLGALRMGSEVNLEPALLAGEALGGHWVQGHVDGTLRVVERRELGEHRVLGFELPAEQRALVMEKGSVTLDGVSLTVAALGEDHFEVALIPHTLEVTTLSQLVPGDRVNFEPDVLAKYVQRALTVWGPTAPR
ncbi:MAG TPA: riboflavin synthase [Thermoanaerobaculia bacterium]|nr:riboflavin synthase [Thermoanaerobaculia bacterium]